MTRCRRTSRIHLAPLFVLLLACGVLSGRLAAQDSEVSVTVQVAEQPGQMMSQVSRASQGANFSVRPSVYNKDSVTFQRKETLNLLLRCINNTTGQVVPFCNVWLSWQARPSTGGHLHDGGRPRGDFEPSSGNTGESGELPTTYIAPEPSGIIDIILFGQLPNGQAVNAAAYTIGVEIPDLVPLGPGANYELEGGAERVPQHPDNHYGTPTFNGMLRTLADSYAAVFPGQHLTYNDMSLAYGGVFDLNFNWRRPHGEHRYGQSCDLNLVPLRQRRRLEQLLIAGGFGPTYKESNHWHIRE